MADKKYLASTGVDKFYYGVLGTDGMTITATAPERVQFLQDIDVAMSSTLVRAHGDNVTAEMAVSHGATTVTGNFHKLPQSDKDVLLGLEVVDGLSGLGSSDNPPYVAVVFAKTYEDGSTEYVGLPKGKFLKTNITGTSKTAETSFGQDAISAEFMDRNVTGFTRPQSVVTGADEAGATTNRDAIFMKVFGKAYPTETVPAG
jgi:phi13 family phage major tail protein